VERDTARRITGHKTDSIFSRYNIVAEEDLPDAARKLEASRKEGEASMSRRRSLASVAPENGSKMGAGGSDSL
jgi:hypothetical protein